MKEIEEHIATNHKNDIDQILLYGSKRYSYNTNTVILLSTITFCIDIKRLDLPLTKLVFSKIETVPLSKKRFSLNPQLVIV